MAKIINGKEISTQLKDELKEKVAQLKEQGIGITLAVVPVSYTHLRSHSAWPSV